MVVEQCYTQNWGLLNEGLSENFSEPKLQQAVPSWIHFDDGKYHRRYGIHVLSAR